MAAEGERYERTMKDGATRTYRVGQVNGAAAAQVVRLDNEVTGKPAWQYADTLNARPWKKLAA